MPARLARSVLAAARRHPRMVGAAQIAAVAIFIGFAIWAISDEIGPASDRLADASVVDFVFGCVAVAVYYLLFVVGWMAILRAWGTRIGYGGALRAEMVSMLAKYVPGGVWTPAARVVAARRAGITDTGLVTASILVEAGISAVAGVIVFAVSLGWTADVDAPLVPLVAFAAVVVVLLHPRLFQPVASLAARKLGGREPPPLRWVTLLGLLGFYAFTWVVGGFGLFFLLRSVGADPALDTVPFLGGVGAVGAIVAVLSVFAPSGLGPREASMYGLLLAVASPAAALGVTVLNRLAITVVEVLLLVVGGLIFRRFERGEDEALAPARVG